MKAVKSAPSVTWHKNRGGRPRAKEAGSSVSAWVPTSAHDRLIQVAKAQDKSVSEVVKVIILNVINVYPAR
jgi:hypothetical protein